MGCPMIQAKLAPLCGVTDSIFRELCFEQGCETAYTEMVSAMGYLCAPKQKAVQDLLIRGENEKKLIVQLFGRDPETVSEAAKRMEALERFDGIDLNMGCPAHKIAASGEGCGLMRTPKIAEQMMRKTVQAVSLPVSVKMRLGWDEEHQNALELAWIAQDAGISEITVHGRTRQQQYSGSADWEAIFRIADQVSIPVYGNGDIVSGMQAQKLLSGTSVAGVMIGRGAMGNPWIFRELNDLNHGRIPEPVSLNERFQMIDEHYRRMLSWKPEHIAVREIRKHVGWYLHGRRGASRVRNEINHAETAAQVRLILEHMRDELETVRSCGGESAPENYLM